MIKVFELTDEYKNLWDEYAQKAPNANMAHLIGWSEVMRIGLGHEPKYLLAFDGNRIRGILPLVVVKTWWRSRYLISLPWMDYGGICADNIDIEKLMLDAAKELTIQQKAKFMELRTINAGKFNLANRTDKVTFLLKLDNDYEVVWKNLNGYVKNRIRKARKLGLTTHWESVKSIDDFYKVFSYNMRDLGTPVWGKTFFKSILETFPQNARLILVKYNQSTIGSALVFSYKGYVSIPAISAYRSYRKMCPNQALYWEVIKDSCEKNYKYLDFGRSSWNSNTFTFKKKWVSDPTQLNWQYYLYKIKTIPSINPDNPKYRILTKVWRKLPLSIANLCGPRVIRNFP